MKKLIRDTLMNPKTGEWSRKNLTAFSSLVYVMWYAAYGMIYDKAVHEFIVLFFASLTGSMLGLSSWEKKNLPLRDTTTTEININETTTTKKDNEP